MDLALSASTVRLDAAGPSRSHLIWEEINSAQVKAAINKQDIIFGSVCSGETF